MLCGGFDSPASLCGALPNSSAGTPPRGRPPGWLWAQNRRRERRGSRGTSSSHAQGLPSAKESRRCALCAPNAPQRASAGQQRLRQLQLAGVGWAQKCRRAPRLAREFAAPRPRPISARRSRRFSPSPRLASLCSAPAISSGKHITSLALEDNRTGAEPPQGAPQQPWHVAGPRPRPSQRERIAPLRPVRRPCPAASICGPAATAPASAGRRGRALSPNVAPRPMW